MELREFITESLTEIIAGIQDAQDAEQTGAFIVPSGVGIGDSFPENRGVRHRARLLTTVVQFDIAVTAEANQTRTGKAGLKIAIVEGGVQGQTGSRSTEASRIQFSVPLLLPESQRTWGTMKSAPKQTHAKME